MIFFKEKQGVGACAADYFISLASVLLWIGMLIAHSRTLRIDEVPDRVIYIYTGEAVIVSVLSGIVFAISILLFFMQRGKPAANRRSARLRIRLSFIPLLIVVVNLCFPVFPTFITHLIVFGVPAVFAWGGLFWYRHRVHSFSPNPAEKKIRDVLLILVISTICYWASGVYYSYSAGEHSGDEGHYLIQAISLYNDGDLDLRNNFKEIPESQRDHVHISSNSRGHHWYSWHSPGLSFLLAAVVPFGVPFRHLLLGAISASALAGMYLLCRSIGAERRSSVLAVALLGTGIYWGIYSSRALPEVLGASLTIYGLLGAISQRNYRWLSMVPSLICVGYLPWVQTRFIPLSITILFLFIFFGMLEKENTYHKVFRLCFFLTVSLLFLGTFQFAQMSMFHKGMSYPVENLLFSLPTGLWHSIASNRGILEMFPLFACGLCATLKLFFSKEKRYFGAALLLVFLCIWLTSCSTVWFSGGKTLPGRFLLVVCPVLVAAVAYIFPSSRKTLQYLILYLGFFPVGIYVMQLSILPEFGRSFADPYNIEKLHPLLSDIARFYYDPYAETAVFPAIVLYAVVLILLFAKKLGRYSLIGLVATLVGTFVLAAEITHVPTIERSKRKLAYMLERRDLEKSLVFTTGETAHPYPLFHLSDRFAGHTETDVGWVTNRDDTNPSLSNLIEISELPVNDWSGRGYKWATLVQPFHGYAGKRAVVLEADVKGDFEFELAIREGNTTLVERKYNNVQELKEYIALEGRGEGKTYILIRLMSGKGQFQTKRIAYSAYSHSLLDKANLFIGIGSLENNR